MAHTGRLHLTILFLAPLLALLLLIGLLWTPILSFSWGNLRDEEHEAAQFHYEHARKAASAGEWASARDSYNAAYNLHPDMWSRLGIAESLDHLGRFDEASALYDAIIESHGENSYQPYHDKARCLERNRGEEAAVAWLAELEAQSGDGIKFRYLLADHHRSFGRPDKALPCYHHALDLIMQKQRVTFSDDDRLTPAARIMEMGQNDLASMWPEVTEIAECYERIGQPEEAYRWATRGISLHQHINRCKGYCSPAQIEAGSTQCRLLRARIHVTRKEWDAAQREIDHAKAFDDASAKSAARRAQAALDRQRTS